MALEFSNVSLSYPGSNAKSVVALERLNFAVANGQVCCVVGPSGCGKTTLLRVAAGLESPSAGEVRFRSAQIAGPSKNRGIVFQAYAAFPWMTARQNVAFGLGGESPGNAGEVDGWLAKVGLSDFADRYPKELSGGMRQRVALARAMIVRPPLLLLDEAFSALDERNRERMHLVLQAHCAETGCAVLLVTHDIREAILLADEVVVLTRRPGRVAKVVPSSFPRPRHRSVIHTPEFAAVQEEILSAFDEP